MTNIFSKLILIASLVLCLIIPTAHSIQAKPIKIVVLPFDIQAEADLNFLKKGIQTMLLSRLHIPDTSLPELGTPGNIPADADYVLTGTLLVFGNSVSTDAQLKKNLSDNTVLAFSRTGESKGEALRHIGMLTDTIKAEILGIQVNPMMPSTNLSLIHDTEKSSPHSDTLPKTKQPARLKVWKSQPFNQKIQSFCIGDVTGDTKNEFIYSTDDAIHVFSHAAGRLVKIASPGKISAKTIISVDVADLNKNKKDEIYVTAIHHNTNKPSSFVMEWDGNQLKTIEKKLPWLFRYVQSSSGGKLLGQRIQENDKVLKPGVFEFSFSSQGALTSTPMKLPEDISLYSLTFGDVLNDGSETIAVLTLDGRLALYALDGKLIWKGSDGYGGSNTYLEYKGMRYNRDDGLKMSRFFLQQRILVADLEKNGYNSVYVVKNYDNAAGVLNYTKFYDKGNIISMKWDDLGLGPEKRTRTISGYLSDYTIADTDNDGKNEIIFCVIKSDGTLSRSYSSRFYSLNELPINVKDSF